MAAFSGLVAISLGLGLAAASGFRVFLPPMLLSGAINVGLIEASGQLALLDGWGAFSVLLIAVVLEIGSYLIPWLDNLLDVVATPTAVLAGVGLMGSVIGAETDYDPIVQWAIAAIGGAGSLELFRLEPLQHAPFQPAPLVDLLTQSFPWLRR